MTNTSTAELAFELAGIADDVRKPFDGVVALPGRLRHAMQAFCQRWGDRGGDSEAPRRAPRLDFPIDGPGHLPALSALEE